MNKSFFKNLRPFLIVIAVTSLYFFPAGRHALKSAVNIFAHGMSDFKIFFLLGLIFILALIWKLLPEKVNTAHLRLTVLLVFFCFAVSLYEFLWLQLRLGTELLSTVNFYEDGLLTSSRLAHIHNAKIILALIVKPLTLLFPHMEIKADYGGPLLHYYSLSAAFFHLIVVILTYVMVLKTLRYMRGSLGRGWFIIYFISLFTILKNIVDGGIFNRELMLAIPIFCGVFHREITGRKKSALYWTAVYLGVFLLFTFPFRLADHADEIFFTPSHFLLLTSIYSFVYLFYEPKAKKRVLLLPLAFLVMVFCIVLFASTFSKTSSLVYLPKDTKIQFLNKNRILNLPSGYESVRVDEVGNYSLHTLRTTTEFAVFKIYENLFRFFMFDRFCISGWNWNPDVTTILWGEITIEEGKDLGDETVVKEPYFNIRLKKIGPNRYTYYGKLTCGKLQFEPLFAYYLHGKGLNQFIFHSM